MKALFFTIVVLFVVLLVFFVVQAQIPNSPSAPQAATGTITVLVNGTPIATGGVLNLKSGTGVIAAASPDPAINGTDILFSADTAFMLSRPTDQAGVDHTLLATSNGTGIGYGASTMPVIQSYTTGQFWVLMPDVPTQPGATLNIDGIGPTPIVGTCSGVCFLIGVGSPIKSWVVH